MPRILIPFVLAALVFAGIGLFLEAGGWALVLAMVSLLAGATVGFAGRGRGRASV